ncbi:unnamed protein product [Alopecurus aequalis]
MAEPTPRPWKDLPADLLTKIAHHLPCLVDRLIMSRTCHDWWFAVQRPPPPRQLPWLFLPDPTTAPLPLLPGSGNTRRASFYCVLGNGDNHNLPIAHDTGGARFFGSYDGGWLLLAHCHASRHALINLHTDRRLFLPDYAYCVRGGVWTPISIAILSATFSSPPGRNTRCYGAAIVSSPCGIRCPQVAIWSMEGAGDRRPVAMGFMGPRLEDVIHHKGAFHFLTTAEQVDVYDISELQDDEGGTFFRVHAHHQCYFTQGAPHSGVRVVARYLVESRGELLMVVKFTTSSPGWVLQTVAFQVYRATQHLTGVGLVQLAWTELPSLDGRMLFVARGCSRAYEVDDFPGFGFGGSIYFLDDWNSVDVDVVSQYGILGRYTRSDDGLGQLVEEEPIPRYAWGDNGMCQWVEGEPHLQVFRRWFMDKERSDNSPPIWFIP